MSSEQLPPNNTSASRPGTREKGQAPSVKGGVRGLLGLPFPDSHLPSTTTLTAPSGAHRSGQLLLPAREENDEIFREVALDEGLIEEWDSPALDAPERPISTLHAYETDTQGNFPRPLQHDSAPLLRSMRKNAADAPTTPTKSSAEQRGRTSLVIPGVSTQRTDFPALAQTAAAPTISLEGEAQETILPKMTPHNTLVLSPQARETTLFDTKFMARLEQLVTEDGKAQHASEARSMPSALSPPSLVDRMGVQNGERGSKDLAQRLEQLQRTVRDLSATLSSHAARNRDESEIQRRERRTPPRQRMAVIKHVEAPSTAPRAFWERSRLGRLHLRTGR